MMHASNSYFTNIIITTSTHWYFTWMEKHAFILKRCVKAYVNINLKWPLNIRVIYCNYIAKSCSQLLIPITFYKCLIWIGFHLRFSLTSSNSLAHGNVIYHFTFYKLKVRLLRGPSSHIAWQKARYLVKEWLTPGCPNGRNVLWGHSHFTPERGRY